MNENIYGLTNDELPLAKRSPTDTSLAYLKSWKAESACGRIYKVSDTNDESDACRHFLWAALLMESLGREKSEDILNAHENNPQQPEDEKSMDLANNRRGISVAERLIKNKAFSEEKGSAGELFRGRRRKNRKHVKQIKCSQNNDASGRPADQYPAVDDNAPAYKKGTVTLEI